MRRTGAVLLAIVVLLSCLPFRALPQGRARNGEQDKTKPPVIVIDRTGAPLRLGLDVRIDGKSPERSWEAFLDHLFDHFDRDGDGRLSAGEAARMFPLPLPDGRELVMTFGNRNPSRKAFKDHCRKGGFMPIVIRFAPPDDAIVRAGQTLFQLLDANGDGRLTRLELSRAAALLYKLDEDEDEVLSLAEVLAGAAKTSPVPGKTSLRLSDPADAAPPDAVLRLTLGKDASGPSCCPEQARMLCIGEHLGSGCALAT